LRDKSQSQWQLLSTEDLEARITATAGTLVHTHRSDRIGSTLGVGLVAQPSRSSPVIRFGVFEVDLRTGELRKQGARIKLQEKPFQALAALLENPGETVSREQLQKKLWPSDTFVDFDHSLNAVINRLREALGDSADNSRFIETLGRRGYRFIGPVNEQVPRQNGATLSDRVRKALFAPLAGALATWRIWLAAAIGLAILCGLAFLLGKRVGERPPPSYRLLTFRRGVIQCARFAPDGRTIVYSAAWDGNSSQLYLTRAESPESLELGLRSAELLSVSSSGEMAVLLRPRTFVREMSIGTLARVPLAGGAPRELLDEVLSADWSPDGSNLAVVRKVGDRVRLEFPIGNVLYETTGWITHVRVSPKADLIAFADHPFPGDDKGSVAVLDLAGHKTVLTGGWVTVQGLAWAPNREEIWFTASKVSQHRAVYAVTLSGGQRVVTSQATTLKLHDISPDGRVLLANDPIRFGIAAWLPKETKEHDFSWFDLSVSRDLSNDGRVLLFSEEGDGPNYGVYLLKTGSSAPIKLGEGMAHELSPDGNWVLSIVRTPPAPILLLPTGPGQPKELADNGINHVSAAWFPDGKQILFAGIEPGRGVRLYVQDLGGGKPRAITPEGVNFFSKPVSPDGKLVAAVDSQNNIWLYPLDGGERRPIPRSGQNNLPVGWSADGRSLYVFERLSVPARVYQFDLATGQKTLWKELVPADPTGVVAIFGLVLTPDGKFYAYSYGRILSELFLVEGLR
jgi:eukaryotic-like serine/threonine-protein kinase